MINRMTPTKMVGTYVLLFLYYAFFLLPILYLIGRHAA